MHLWTDYEGKTIAGAYPLNKLLRSEGRSAFFSTRDPEGSSAVLRLTEAHFDESEMMKRWSKVSELHQANLIEIEKFGETTVDGVTLAYALLESNDANLGEVLKERPLTSAETLQVARSVAGALAALHSCGLVHEHVDPTNVLAVGEQVKLRSDCVRECVADMEFASAEDCRKLRRQDMSDYGTLLLRCLTLEKEMKPGIKLPDPFSQVIPQALDGSWEWTQIQAALTPRAASSQVAASSSSRPQATLVPDQVLSAASGTRNEVRNAGQNGAKNGSQPQPQAQAEDEARARRESSPDTAAATPRERRMYPRNEPAPLEPATVRPGSVLAIGAAAVFIVLLGWYFLFHRAAQHTQSAQPAAALTQPAPQAVAPIASSTLAAARPAPPSTHAPVQAGWRVIAYTYNRQGPALAQVARIEQRHPGLHAEFFAPGGHAPYLVALSGPLSESEAKSVLSRARREGMPRDSFIRRY